MSIQIHSDVVALLNNAGAILTGGHFVYASGRHGDTYVNKDALYPDPIVASELGVDLALGFIERDVRVETVIAPAIGGIILSQWTAYHLMEYYYGADALIHSVYADKKESNYAIGRGYGRFVAGKNVAVVEDNLTTGGAVRKVVHAVRSLGGNVVAVGAVCNRGNVTAHDVGDVDVFFSLVDADTIERELGIKLESWREEECPFCRDNVPINTEFGKGAEYRERKMIMERLA